MKVDVKNANEIEKVIPLLASIFSADDLFKKMKVTFDVSSIYNESFILPKPFNLKQKLLQMGKGGGCSKPEPPTDNMLRYQNIFPKHIKIRHDLKIEECESLLKSFDRSLLTFNHIEVDVKTSDDLKILEEISKRTKRITLNISLKECEIKD